MRRGLQVALLVPLIAVALAARPPAFRDDPQTAPAVATGPSTPEVLAFAPSPVAMCALPVVVRVSVGPRLDTLAGLAFVACPRSTPIDSASYRSSFDRSDSARVRTRNFRDVRPLTRLHAKLGARFALNRYQRGRGFL